MIKEKGKYWIVFFILLMFFAFDLTAANVIYNPKDQAQLTNLYVTCFAKDQKGFLWIGTSMGLNRWDGYEFKQYFSRKDVRSSLSSNRIQSLHIDNNGILWVGTSYGLNKYDPRTDKFQHFFHSKDDTTTLSSNNISFITSDLKGRLWIGTTNSGINIMNVKNGKVKRLNITIESEHGFDYNQIRSLQCDSAGTMWAGFNYSGILKINPDDFSHQFFFDFTENGKTYEIRGINHITHPAANKLLLATWGGKVIQVNIGDETKFSNWQGNKYIESNIADFIGCDKKGTVWVADKNNKIIRYRHDGTLLETIKKDPQNNNIPSTQLSALFVDGTKVWAGTYNNGFFHIDFSEKHIANLEIYSHNNEKIVHRNINAITKGENNIVYFSTFDGNLISYNEKTGTGKVTDLNTNLTQSAYYDPYHKQLIIGDYSKNFRYYTPKTGNFGTFTTFDTEYSQSLFSTNDSLLIYAVWNYGIYIYNYNTGKITWPAGDFAHSNFSSMDMLLEDDQLWIASYNNGLINYNLSTNTFHQYTFEDISSSMNPSKMVNLVKRLKDGRLLVITTELGICILDEETSTFKKVETKYDIFNKIHIKAIEQDNDSTLWIFTDRKILKSNPNFNNLTEYTTHDGLNLGVQHKATYFSPGTNRIYFGGHNGIQYFNVNKMAWTKGSYDVVITDIQLFGKSISPSSDILQNQSIPYTDTLFLNYRQNMLGIEFSSLQFYTLSNAEYRYMLEGVNDNWVTVPNNRNNVTYSNLSPGNYTFKVKSSDEHGVWNDDYTSLTFFIKPPFWMTNWFKYLSITILIALVWLIFKLREQSFRKEKEKLENLVNIRTNEILNQKEKLEKQNGELEKANDEKDRFFQIIAHDLKNPVSSVSQLIELAITNFETIPKKQLKEIIDSAHKSADSIIELLDDLLIWAKSQTDKINFDFEPLKLRSIIVSEMQNLNPQIINKSIKVENNVPDNIVVYADSYSLKTVYRNLISNAVKFSYNNGIIKAGCKINEDEIICYVKDYGTGMTENTAKKLFKLSNIESKEGTSGEKGTGLGLNLCKEFINAHNGKIWAESKTGKGSTFFFSLPYNQYSGEK
ncbi:MAG: hypothetical protein K9H26_04685 [Prolixibacteraceae bacterium]|nr:hypothetical protein [Prolixibacteraceae bacterium]